MRRFIPLPVLLTVHFASHAQMECRSAQYREEQLHNNPRMAIAVQQIETFTRHQLQARSVTVTGTALIHSQPDLITIPVVVHVIYNTAEQNISDAQVNSQIDVLNRDYRKLNPDTLGIPAYYSPRAADCGFRFALAGLDPNGNPTSGIVRRHTNQTSFVDHSDAIKFSASGGDDAWDRDRYLNIWVGNLDRVLGYSSFVGGPKETDGIVVVYTAFGTMGTAAAPYNLGRTSTHEIGHWLNLIHVWGDADCGDDQVADTPPQHNGTYGNPSGIVISCGNGPYGNMYMNYMDFTDDIGMHMFTSGQRDRMRTLFDEGGFRYPILSSHVVTELPASAGASPAPSASGNILRIYPNPVFDITSLDLPAGSQPGGILEVYNQVGQKMMTMRITSLHLQLDLAPLPKGMYFLKVNDGKKERSARLVKL